MSGFGGDPFNPIGQGGVAPPTLPGPTRQPIAIPNDPDVGWFVAEGWRLLWSDWPLIAGASILTWLISLVASFIPLVGSFSGFFIAPLYVAAGFLAVRKWRGDTPRLSEIFELREKYWPLVLQQLLVFLLLLLPWVPAAIAIVSVWLWFSAASTGGTATNPMLVGSIAVTVVVALLTLLGATYLTMRLAFAGYTFMDAPKDSLTAVDAISKSWEATKPWSWKLFGVGIVLSIAVLFSLMLLIIGGVLIGLPLYIATVAVCYAVMSPRPDAWRYCKACGYDMLHAPLGQCPECGTFMQPPPIPTP